MYRVGKMSKKRQPSTPPEEVEDVEVTSPHLQSAPQRKRKRRETQRHHQREESLQQQAVQQQPLKKRRKSSGTTASKVKEEQQQKAREQQMQEQHHLLLLNGEDHQWSLIPEEALLQYTTGSGIMNAKLRDGQRAEYICPGLLKGVQDRLEIIEQPLYRFERYLSFRLDENDNSKVVFPEFTSTSVGSGPHYAIPMSYPDDGSRLPNSHRYILRFRKGMKGAMVEDLSAYSEENEVILPPGTRCRVLKREKNERGGEDIELEGIWSVIRYF
ncbi:hypothetical protein HK097_009722 [Rhizophlyctis rosea]|uniref:ADP ribosyltransferase domain-containing protein n=1 Tax=Rhizophlyctis rosea TaxID=64517 RepID=A0AAD5X309_9FUNG|nr:hypothetical protein HK097_009722 [Rhizophlyctis rosea]